MNPNQVRSKAFVFQKYEQPPVPSAATSQVISPTYLNYQQRMLPSRITQLQRPPHLQISDSADDNEEDVLQLSDDFGVGDDDLDNQDECDEDEVEEAEEGHNQKRTAFKAGQRKQQNQPLPTSFPSNKQAFQSHVTNQRPAAISSTQAMSTAASAKSRGYSSYRDTLHHQRQFSQQKLINMRENRETQDHQVSLSNEQENHTAYTETVPNTQGQLIAREQTYGQHIRNSLKKQEMGKNIVAMHSIPIQLLDGNSSNDSQNNSNSFELEMPTNRLRTPTHQLPQVDDHMHHNQQQQQKRHLPNIPQQLAQKQDFEQHRHEMISVRQMHLSLYSNNSNLHSPVNLFSAKQMIEFPSESQQQLPPPLSPEKPVNGNDAESIRRDLRIRRNQLLFEEAQSRKKALELIGEADSTEDQAIATSIFANQQSHSMHPVVTASGGSSGPSSVSRIPIKEYVERCREQECGLSLLGRSTGSIQKKSSLFAQKETKSVGKSGTAGMIGMGGLVPSQNSIPPRSQTVAGEIHHTKMIVKKAMKERIKPVRTKLVQLSTILQRVLRLVQIKRLFQKNYQLSELQYELISDVSHCVMENVTEENKILRHFNCIATQLNRPLKLFLRLLPKISAKSVLRPESKLNLIWMLLQLVIYSIYLSTVSVSLFFSDEVFSSKSTTVNSEEKWFNIFAVLSITILDFIKELNCGYYHCGEVVVDRKLIMAKYLHSPRVYFDFLAFLSLLSDIIDVNWANAYVIQVFKMFIFFKLFTIYEVIVKIQSHFLFSVSWNNWINLAKLIIIAVFTCHCMAILYYQQALLQIRYLGSVNTWVNMANLLEEPSQSLRYIQSFYNATTLMVAAIQFNPVEPMESLFVTLATIGNTAFFGFVVTAIGTIVENFHKRTQEYRRELAILNQFMDTTNIPKELQIRVRNYLEYHHSQQETMDHTEFNEILTKLPIKIKNEVQVVVNSSYVSQLPVIADNFSPNFISKLISKIHEIKYIPGDLIVQEGIPDDCSLYLILEGKVDIFLHNNTHNRNKLKSNVMPPRSNSMSSSPSPANTHTTLTSSSSNNIIGGDESIIAELTKGMYFGEYAFFSGGQRQASVKASSYCTLAKVKREDFLQSLEYFHEDFEKFKLKQDQLILYSNFATISLACCVCGSDKHLARKCPTVRILPYNVTIINAYNRPAAQDRLSDILRLSPPKFNPRANLHPLMASAIGITENYQDDIDELERTEMNWKHEQKKSGGHSSRSHHHERDHPKESHHPKPNHQEAISPSNNNNSSTTPAAAIQSIYKLQQQQQHIDTINDSYQIRRKNISMQGFASSPRNQTNLPCSHRGSKLTRGMSSMKNKLPIPTIPEGGDDQQYVEPFAQSNPQLQFASSPAKKSVLKLNSNRKSNLSTVSYTQPQQFDPDSSQSQPPPPPHQLQLYAPAISESSSQDSSSDSDAQESSQGGGVNGVHPGRFDMYNQRYSRGSENSSYSNNNYVANAVAANRHRSIFQNAQKRVSGAGGAFPFEFAHNGTKGRHSPRAGSRNSLGYEQPSPHQQQQQQQHYIQQQQQNLKIPMEQLKSYVHYYPEYNFTTIIKMLISKKVVHSSRIGKFVSKVNKIQQHRQKNIIKIKLFQSELKKKELRAGGDSRLGTTIARRTSLKR